MKVVILNGSAAGDNACDSVQEVIADELTRMGWEVESFTLHDMEICHCLSCFGCWVKTPGICVIQDAGHDVARSFIRSDLAVLLTPVTFGGYSSELKKAVDRLICLISPLFMKIQGEVHHRPRYERYPRLMGVGLLPREDKESEKIFTSLVSRNALNLHAPAHAGGVIITGKGADKIKSIIQELFTAVGVI